MSEIGNMLRRLRKEHGLTQEGLAEKVDISRHALACVESERRNLTIRNCCLIAAAFDQAPEDWAYAAARDGIALYSSRKR